MYAQEQLPYSSPDSALILHSHYEHHSGLCRTGIARHSRALRVLLAVVSPLLTPARVGGEALANAVTGKQLLLLHALVLHTSMI
jgi:hypothetical protein